MNIFGIGMAELVTILIVMLVVAGPQRMIRWSYVAGQYAGKIQRLWSEVGEQLQREFDEAGVDVTVPRQPPTRARMKQQLDRSIRQMAQPDAPDRRAGEVAAADATPAGEADRAQRSA